MNAVRPLRDDAIYGVRARVAARCARWHRDGGVVGLLMNAIMPENERVIDYGRAYICNVYTCMRA